MSGFHLVTLPIGNNKDLTLRAKETLEAAKIILAEDTRVFKEFCKHNEISLESKQIDSFHDHTDDRKTARFIDLAKDTEVVLVSDAGSPIISDPAYPLIQAAIKNQLNIKSSPGVNSVTLALELSGLPPSPFHFHAFIPRDKGKRKKFAEQILEQYGTHIFFEGVSRVKETLDILSEQIPEENFCVCRELTKEFESVYRFKGSQWAQFKDVITYKGEFVILVHNSRNTNKSISSEVSTLANELIEKGSHPKKLSKLLSLLTDKSAKEIYQILQNK